MSGPEPIDRRTALGTLGGLAGALALPSSIALHAPFSGGRLKQSVCRWCYNAIPLDVLCREAKAMGLRSVELVEEREWGVVRAHGLTCAMANGPSTIPIGFNRPDQHDRLVAESERLLPRIADAGFPNMIVFAGNRAGLSDGEGIANCAAGISRVTPIAERFGVTVCMELLNSKIDHRDYQCDHAAWGADVVKRVNSPHFKLLYDIYHMQIMEGDVIRTIRDNIAHIGHFHTGGVPGRGEIDDTQELNYPAIARAIVASGYTGYLAQEFVPTRDPLTSLRQGVSLCDV